VKAENTTVQIEVETDGKIVLAFGRKLDHLLIPWQDAFNLAETLGMAINDARNELDVFDYSTIKRESEQIRLGAYDGMVALVFEHADRVSLNWRAAELVTMALRVKAQDVQFAQRMVQMPTLREDGKLQWIAELVR
jgi:hypothetical protein